MNNDLFIFIPETCSTNIFLAKMAEDKRLEGSKLEDFTVIYSDYQTAGKGLSENQWHSNPKENILTSLYFTPAISPQKQFYFNVFFSLSVKKMLDRYLDVVKIKWPNDIYINDKKIAGILIEHTIQGDSLMQSIAGVGINLNQTQFSPSIPNPTSLKLETGYQYGRISLIKELAVKAVPYYEKLLNGDYKNLLNDYYRYLYRFNEYHYYMIKKEKAEARIVGTDEYGHLLLEKKNGVRCHCGYKEVEYLWE